MKSIRLFGAALLASTTLLGAGQAFASEPLVGAPNSAETPVTAELTVDENPGKPVLPTDPDGGTDEDTGVSGLFGIAYAPGALAGQGQLNESGTTEISLSNAHTTANPTNKHNVAVQDKTRAKDRNWSLSATLTWTGDTDGYMNGVTVTAENGNVTLNTNGTLGSSADGEVVMSIDADNLTISSTETNVMEAVPGKTVNGVYNYQFQNPKLVIPNSEDVPAGTYSGNIVWNLSDAI